MTQENALSTVENMSIEYILPASTAEQNPALVYLARLTSSTSRYTMTHALNTIADVINPMLQSQLSQPEVNSRCQFIDWSLLRHQHTNAIRARLAEQYKPATVNKLLAALRGVLEAAFNLQQISAGDYQRAINVKNVKNETLRDAVDLLDVPDIWFE